MSGRSVVVFEATGDGGVSVEGDSGPRASRAGSRRLREISHLYISQRPAAAAPRRALRVAVSGTGLVSAECTASLAVQWARLGRRVLVADLDPSLPNAGFRLGLSPAAYLRELAGTPAMVEHGVLGVRVVIASRADADAVAAFAAAARQADVLLLRVAPGDVEAALAPHRAALDLPPAATTMERAARASPMFEAWMATARRPQRREPAARLDRDGGLAAWLDVVVPVGDATFVTGEPEVPVRPIDWGEAAPAAGRANVPAHAAPPVLPLAVLEPEHAVGRVFESFAQALLAGLGRRREAEPRG